MKFCWIDSPWLSSRKEKQQEQENREITQKLSSQNHSPRPQNFRKKHRTTFKQPKTIICKIVVTCLCCIISISSTRLHLDSIAKKRSENSQKDTKKRTDEQTMPK